MPRTATSSPTSNDAFETLASPEKSSLNQPKHPAINEPPSPKKTLKLANQSPALPISPDEQGRVFSQVKKDVIKALHTNTIDAEVIDRCTRLLELDGSNTSALVLRAIAYRLTGAPAECIKDCNRILSKDPANRFALLHRASAYSSYQMFFNNFSREMVDHILEAQRWAKGFPQDRFAVFIRAILVGSGEGSGALVKDLTDILHQSPDDVLAAVVLLAVLHARNNLISNKTEINKMVDLAKTIMKLDHGNLLAAQALWRLAGHNEYMFYRNPRSDPTEIFADYPLLQQDQTLDAYLQSLP